MSEHTPGPWKWMHTPRVHTLDFPRNAPDIEWSGEGEFDYDGECYLSFDELRGEDGDEVLYGVWCNDDTAEVGVSSADACLIAAAPDLLEALKEVVAITGDRKTVEFDRARAAIAKAEGAEARP